jgi:hypothetical protein
LATWLFPGRIDALNIEIIRVSNARAWRGCI